jgi:Flp pilus assembly protein TadB
MEEFLHINFGNLLTIFTFLSGMVAFAYTIKTDVRVQSVRLEAIEDELSELRKVVVTMARQEERINAMDMRMLEQGKRVDAQGGRLTSLERLVAKNA